MRVSDRLRQWVVWGLRMVVGLGLMVALVWHADPRRVLEALASARPEPLAWAAALFLGGVLFSAVPWKLLLAPVEVRLSWRDAVELSLMGFCVNNLVPGGLGGDVLRAWVAATRSRHPVGAVASVLLDRWLAFVCLLLLAVGIALAYRGPLAEAGLTSATLAAVAVLVVMFAVSLALFAWGVDLARPVLDRLTMGAPAEGLVEALRGYGRHPRLLGLCLGLTMVTPLLDAAGFYLIGAGLGLEVPLWPYLLMIPVLRVIHHVPVSVNAFGTQDVAVVFFWGAFGVAEPAALVMSMAAHGLKILVAILSGALYLGVWDGRLRNLSAGPPPPGAP